MAEPSPCIFDVASDLTAHGARSLRPGEAPHRRLLPAADSAPLPGCSQLDLFALMFLPVWALVNI